MKTFWQTIRSYIFYSEQVDPLMGLRGFACLLVVWSHVEQIYGWIIIRNIDLTSIAAPSGLVAVLIFYLLSGYTVGYGFFSKKYTLSLPSLRSFYINRVLRIAPAYYVCILACIFIFYRQTTVTFYDIVRFFTFTANYDLTSLPFQTLLVIISTEMQFYLVAPLLFAVLTHIVRKIPPVIIGIYILCLGSAVRYLLLLLGFVNDYQGYRTNIYVTLWGNVDVFLFGMFVSYLLCERKADVIALKKRIPNPIYPLILIGWFLWINYRLYITIMTWYSWPQDVINHLFLLPPTLCLVIGWYILSTNVNYVYGHGVSTVSHVVKLLLHPKTFFFGIGFLSYGLYLYHYVFFDLLYLKRPGYDLGITPSLSRFFVVLGVTIITALISYKFVELPFLRLKHKKQ
jgi:peptidoglycan/LPS O-acetylase OafA/YrhL